MARQSKITKRSSAPVAAKGASKTPTFSCSRCGMEYARQQGNFSPSVSTLYRANNGYLTVCHQCVDDLFNHYKDVYEGKEALALQRVCMKMDIYWSPTIYANLSKDETTSRVKQYIVRVGLAKKSNKTYDDYLDESSGAETDVDEALGGYPEPDDATLAFWGSGHSPDFYYALNMRYQNWTKNLPQPLETGAEALYKQICILEETINRNVIDGKNIDSLVKTLNDLLGSVNQKPSQKKDEADEDFDSLPFGMKIRMVENSKPIPKPLPEWEDVDGIVRYISIWFISDRPLAQRCA